MASQFHNPRDPRDGGSGGGRGDVHSQFPSNRALESIIPGLGLMTPLLGLLSQFLQPFNIDGSLLVTILLVNVGLLSFLRYLWNNLISPLATSSVMIPSEDDVHEHVMIWLAKQTVMEQSRRLMVKSKRNNEFGGRGEMKRRWIEMQRGVAEQEQAPSTRYEPAYGNHHFWWKGRYYFLRRTMKPNLLEAQRGRGGSEGDQESITITCVSWSTAPLKRLIEAAGEEYKKQKENTTSVRVPSNNMAWKRLSTIPSRPIETLSLPTEQRNALVSDLQQFLKPSEQAWYNRRGIPYRRGYLFYGPPGTGKTSLAHVLAGMFELDIHVVNLLEPTLTEFKLTSLFQNLPSRCIVLLEDIDSAGLERRAPSTTTFVGRPMRGETSEDFSAGSGGISLSCILNVIDGLVAHEGRILFMTSNFPERLDDALVRPGRVDFKLAMELATHQQIKELFIKMYMDDDDEDEESQKKNLEVLAEDFASRIPEKALSPAEIQGHLLLNRSQPHKAIEQAEVWLSRTFANREKQKQEELEKAEREKAEAVARAKAEAERGPEDEDKAKAPHLDGRHGPDGVVDSDAFPADRTRRRKGLRMLHDKRHGDENLY